jgi:hypothetical protein
METVCTDLFTRLNDLYDAVAFHEDKIAVAAKLDALVGIATIDKDDKITWTVNGQLMADYADDAKELANALLNYGALAENAFASPENKTDVEEVNKNVNDQFTKLDTDTKMDSSKVSNSVYYGASVNVESYLGFNFKFRAEAAKGATYAVITYGKNEVKVNITFDDNGLAIVTLNGLKASEADLALTCTLYDDNGTKIATATDSVYNYCARALAGLDKMDETTYGKQNFKSEFYKSLVLYIEAAKNYAEEIKE